MKATGAMNNEQWSKTRTTDIFQALTAGELRKRDFVNALSSRIGYKFSNLKNIFDDKSDQLSYIPDIDVNWKKAKTLEQGWQAKGFGNAFSRGIGIWTFGISILLQEKRLKKVKDEGLKKLKRKKIAIKLRRGLLELGPTFIKLGQLLSTRIDVIPKEYIDELVQLQDNVPGFSGTRAISIIEEELGSPLNDMYLTFETTPIAAASLGQVHAATLKETGAKVAVKVQREGLQRLFDQDLKNLKILVQIFDKLDPKLDGADRNWVRIYEESARLLYKEIDYRQEAENARRFKANFAGTEWIKVPEIIEELSSNRVLTMEYVEGIKINNIKAIEEKGIDRKLLAKRSAEAFLTQLCRHSLFHSDPHPGNLACDNVNGGRLIFYDFGMMDELSPVVRAGLVNLIFSIYENNAKLFCDALEQMGVLKSGSDRVSIESIARTFLDEFSATLNEPKGGSSNKSSQIEGKWVNEMSADERARIRKERRLKLGAELLSVTSDVPFQFPPTFTFVFRAFTSLDGIGKGLDPSYDLTRLAKPYLRELLDLRDGSVAASAVKSFTKAVGWRGEDIAATVQSPRNVAYIKDVVKKLEQGDLKLRTRVLESERSFQRSELVQTAILCAVAFGSFLNASIILFVINILNSASGVPYLKLARGSLALAGLFGLKSVVNVFKVNRQDRRLKSYGLR